MRANSLDLWQLATRIRMGDEVAAVTFVLEFERQLGRVIRRQVQSGATNSEVDRRIASAIGQIFGDDPSATMDRELLIRAASDRISLAALESIRASRGAMETIADR